MGGETKKEYLTRFRKTEISGILWKTYHIQQASY